MMLSGETKEFQVKERARKGQGTHGSGTRMKI